MLQVLEGSSLLHDLVLVRKLEALYATFVTFHGSIDSCKLVFHLQTTCTVNSFNFVGTQYCGLMTMDMFVDTLICRF